VHVIEQLRSFPHSAFISSNPCISSTRNDTKSLRECPFLHHQRLTIEMPHRIVDAPEQRIDKIPTEHLKSIPRLLQANIILCLLETDTEGPEHPAQ
jgi:hypothetical protein